MRIKGKVAIVTGASSGIGSAIAMALAKKGAHIALVARRKERMDLIKEQLQNVDVKVEIYVCDLTDLTQIDAAYHKIVKNLGVPDILVNAAGIGIWKPLMQISLDEHHRMMDVNYWGAFYWIRNALPDMLRGGRKRIVNISSGSGKIGFSGTTGYSASKFALTGLSEALHRELMSTSVGISCIHPGSVKTDFWNEEKIPSQYIPALIKYSPKLSAHAIAREVIHCIWFGFPVRTTPIFLAFLVRINSLWIRLGDLMIWKWFFPLIVLLFIARISYKLFF